MIEINIHYMDLIGYVSGILLALCGLPEALRSIKNKRCDIGWGLLLMWLGGELGLLIYELKTMDIPRLINYSCNILFISVMIWYKLKIIKCKFCKEPCNNAWCSTKGG